MKLIIDPDWYVIAKDLTTDERSEILLAILGYPDYGCAVPIWKFFKLQIDREQAKYRAKCERLAANQKSSSKNELSESINSLSAPICDLSKSISHSSPAIAKEVSTESNQYNKTSQSKSMDGFLDDFAKNFSPNRPVKLRIDNEFSIAEIIKRNPDLLEFFKQIPLEKLEMAEKSLKEKCFGQEKTMKQILGWILNEGNFKGFSKK